MNIDFDFEDRRVNYPEPGMILEFRRKRFIELCYIILYSNDERKIQHAYDIIFREYRMSIINGDFCVAVSVFEEVILKILNDADNNLYEKYGVQNSPFLRFVALIKEQEERFKSSNYSHPYNPYSRVQMSFRIKLKSYLLMFIDGHKDKIKNNYIRRLIHLYFSSIK
jgi:hypothetical protein